MIFKSLLSTLFLFLFFAGSFASEPCKVNDKLNETISSKDSLIVGKNYIFGTKKYKQFTGDFLGQDSLYYRIKTNEGNIRIKKDEIEIYKINNSEELVEQPEFIISKDTLVNIVLKDGNEITGYIISRDSAGITVKTRSNITVKLPANQIVEIERSPIEYENGNFYIKDPNDARLFLAPTARPIRKNTGFLSDVELFFPMVGFGIENYVSIVGGISIIPFAKNQLLYINAKVTPVQTKNVDLAAGFIYMNATSNSEGLSIGYTGGTFGSKSASVTAGIGLTFQKSSSQTPLFILGGEVRVDNHTKLLMENWIFTYKDSPAFSFAGIRFFGSKLAVDFALLKIWDKDLKSNAWPFFPYVSFTYNLNFN